MSNKEAYFKYLRGLPKNCKNYDENKRRCLFFDLCSCDGTDETCDQYGED